MSRRDPRQGPMLRIIGWSTAIFLCVIAFFGSVLFKSSPPERGAVEMLLANNEKGFANVEPGYAITFPKDYGVHEEFRQEWWYVTANLSDKDGNKYGIQWTVFRSAVSPEKGEQWDNQQIYMAHAVLTTSEQMYSSERFSRGGIGQAGVSSQPFSVWLDDWEWTSASKEVFPSILVAGENTFSFYLNMKRTQSEVLQGVDGYSKKHAKDNVASYYFSVPAVDIAGTIMIEGESVDVTGKGWIDREWSTKALSDDQKGWDWFALQFEDGDSLVMVQVRSENGPYRFGSLTNAEGETVILQPEEIEMMPQTFTKVSSGRYVPTEWQLKLPKHGIDITTSPLNEQNWLSFAFPYWEGPIEITGSKQGVGFMEVTGY
ncbi:carotenoid 1,2-hydratase [Enterovibrio sp. ZSDZ35]|uniref:Carotenoid 1,2-hydratase n=1 Tax=Enterovibrio qingdaonensis TaxID=2899818 RepID=A0ABT5QI30_9GAMM|nr:lipocalin-like domain-containing protein [Enterovibrio sp. ZSDZ35]MDD1780628.1 carotenoid 1,2-hydratase [Enterovibrio sp. ZSDZ35]